MKISLDLSRHCIQTAARLKLEHLIRQYLKAPDQGAEAMIEVLTQFLSLNDFGELRRRIEEARRSLKVRPESSLVLDLSKDLINPFSCLELGPDCCLLSITASGSQSK